MIGLLLRYRVDGLHAAAMLLATRIFTSSVVASVGVRNAYGTERLRWRSRFELAPGVSDDCGSSHTLVPVRIGCRIQIIGVEKRGVALFHALKPRSICSKHSANCDYSLHVGVE